MDEDPEPSKDQMADGSRRIGCQSRLSGTHSNTGNWRAGHSGISTVSWGVREGGFCSLDCYTNFYHLALAERARRLAERIKRKES